MIVGKFVYAKYDAQYVSFFLHGYDVADNAAVVDLAVLGKLVSVDK